MSNQVRRSTRLANKSKTPMKRVKTPSPSTREKISTINTFHTQKSLSPPTRRVIRQSPSTKRTKRSPTQKSPNKSPKSKSPSKNKSLSPKRKSPPIAPTRNSPPKTTKRKQITTTTLTKIPPRIIGTFNNDMYEPIDLIGSGGFGNVWRAKDSNNEMVAVKVFETEKDTDYQRELHFGKLIKQFNNTEEKCNPYVVCVLDTGYFQTNDYEDKRFIVYELMDGDLDDYQFTSFRELLQALYDTSRGLLWIHNKQLAHADMKPANLLYKKDALVENWKGTIENRTVFKIGDLGGSCSVLPSEPSYANYKGTYTFKCVNGGTPFFSAPEVLSSQNSTPSYKDKQKSDIFSLGVTFYVLSKKFMQVHQNYLFNFPYLKRNNTKTMYVNEIMDSIKARVPVTPLTQEEIIPLNFTYEPEAQLFTDLINKMLQANPLKRIILPRLIQALHTYFTQH